MLTPEQIAALQDVASHITDPINDFLIEDIARRISEAGQLTSTAAYQVWQAQQLGVSQRQLKKELRKRLKVSHRELRKLLTQTAEVGYDFDIKRLPFVQAVPFHANESLQQIVAAAVALAGKDLDNMTRTLGMVDPFGRALPLQDVYRSCTDFAFKQVLTGAADYNTAIRTACANIAKYGVRTINYESGVHTSLEAAVRRNIMGGLGLMNEQIEQQNHDDLGCDGWEISAHANSAPDHEPIQGKQYSDAEYTALNNSLVRRIGTLNCGHVAFPIILGINSPQYTAEQLRQFREDNEKGITYQGKHYTGYEATQMQRKIERSIRAQKNRILVDETTGDAEKLQPDRIRLQQLNAEYKRFSAAAGLRTEPERAQVAGFGRGEAARATAVYRRQESIVSSFKRKMQEAGISIKGFDSYAGDARILEEMQTAFSRLSGQYPEVAEGLTVVLSHSTDNTTIGWYDRKTQSIHYNHSLLKNWGELQEEYAELMEAGHFPTGTDARAFFYHEYGHAVWDTKEMGSLRKPVDKVLLRLGYGHVNVGQRELALRRELSAYATTDTRPAYQEVIAEAFSEWYTSNKPRRFCQEFLKEMGII
ncbi:phage minor capsid protein [Anaeromassilibacillus senegalensis]|uniref:phage minor capsid protein n=1 Tax=Anaeromassilibacillus senegalensis TaxID=1673717 RepID=UPI0006814CA4|nr:phage minor capsid protein [Anaeromassilibacillus senegalensis]